MLKTHTGARIYTDPDSWSCGDWSVFTADIEENRPGRARQMRRMVAKAKRRERRGYIPPAVKRARVVSAARAEVRHGGKVIGYATDFRVTMSTPAELAREVEGGFSVEGTFTTLDAADFATPAIERVMRSARELEVAQAANVAMLNATPRAPMWEPEVIAGDDAPRKEGEP